LSFQGDPLDFLSCIGILVAFLVRRDVSKSDEQRNGIRMKLKCMQLAGLAPGRSVAKDIAVGTSAIRVTARQKPHQLFMLRQLAIAGAVLLCLLFAASQSYSERVSGPDERTALELSALGKQGDTIARARDYTLDILQHENSCTAWFKETDPESAEVFRSLHFELDENGPSLAYIRRDSERGLLVKQPWAAKSMEAGGRNSIILLNAGGAFFNRSSILMQIYPGEILARPMGNRPLEVSSYSGNTPEVQITILLHELGHIVGRLPEDGDSWDGHSSRNSAEVLRHCKAAIQATTHRNLRSSN
jgi:hypothetical protein